MVVVVVDEVPGDGRVVDVVLGVVVDVVDVVLDGFGGSPWAGIRRSATAGGARSSTTPKASTSALGANRGIDVAIGNFGLPLSGAPPAEL